MNRVVHSVAACLLLVAFAVGASLAQEEDNGGMVIRGQMDEVRLFDLVEMYVEASGRTVIFQPAQIRQTVTLSAPTTGSRMSEYAVLQSALQQFRLTLVSVGPFDHLLPVVEAAKFARTVTLEELQAAEDMEFVRLVVHLDNADPTVVMGAIRNVVSPQGGMVHPVQSSRHGQVSGALLICDYVYNLKEVVKLIHQIDTPVKPVAQMHTEIVEIKHGNPTELAGTVERHGFNMVILTASRSASSVVVSGPQSEVARIVKLLRTLDEAAGQQTPAASDD